MSNDLFVVVIDPATHTAEIECFEAIAHRPGVRDASYHRPALDGMNSLEETATPDAVIILGSGASVYDELPWQRPLNMWARATMDAGIPTLGICYGHQMIAHLFGAPIELLWDGQKVKGQRTVRIQSERLDLANDEGPLAVSHREGVTECPAGFRVCATSSDVRIDALEHHALPIWGVQAHVEAVPAFLMNNNVTLSDPDAVFEFGYRIIDAFLKVAAEHQQY